MWFTNLLLIIIMLVKDVISVQLQELRVPAHVAEGSDVMLMCIFDLEKDRLFLVKWYKDQNEFYRYSENGTQYFPEKGVNVDMTRSSKDMVWLKNVSSASTGFYTCEVQGEAPSFAIDSATKHISVQLLPKAEPIISGEQEQYRVGDIALVNCTSQPSRPETQLTWWINDRPAPRMFQRAQWIQQAPTRTDAFITTLQLHFRVTSSHFRQGVMKLKCEASIAPTYNQQISIDARSSLFKPQFDNNSQEFDDPDKESSPYEEHSHRSIYNSSRSSESIQKISLILLTMELILYIVLLFQAENYFLSRIIE